MENVMVSTYTVVAWEWNHSSSHIALFSESSVEELSQQQSDNIQSRFTGHHHTTHFQVSLNIFSQQRDKKFKRS